MYLPQSAARGGHAWLRRGGVPHHATPPPPGAARSRQPHRQGMYLYSRSCLVDVYVKLVRMVYRVYFLSSVSLRGRSSFRNSVMLVTVFRVGQPQILLNVWMFWMWNKECGAISPARKCIYLLRRAELRLVEVCGHGDPSEAGVYGGKRS